MKHRCDWWKQIVSSIVILYCQKKININIVLPPFKLFETLILQTLKWNAISVLQSVCLPTAQQKHTLMCPSNNINKQNHSLAHGPYKYQQKWQLNRSSLNTLHSPWHSLWSSLQFITKKQKESWKEPPVSYLPLLFLLAKPSHSHSLANTTLLGLRILSDAILGNQRSN